MPTRRTRWFGVATRVLRIALAAVPVVLIPAFEWIPGVPADVRPILIITALVGASVGVVWTAVDEQRRQRDDLERAALTARLEREGSRLKTALSAGDPDRLLHRVGESIFRDGAWRLTVYRKSAPQPHEIVLEKLASAASDVDTSRSSPARVRIGQTSELRRLFDSNLADARYLTAGESGAFVPDHVDNEDAAALESYEIELAAWRVWRTAVIGPSQREDIGLPGFRPRKLAWFGVQHPDSHAILVVLAESASEGGIEVTHLGHNLTRAWTLFIDQLVTMRQAALETADLPTAEQAAS